MLTSGTTGPSKAVVCTYVQAWSGSAMGMDYFDADDRLLANLPLFHVSGAGAVLDRLAKGGTCVLYDGFKPATFWDTVRRFNITGCCLVGAMTQFLLRQPPSERDRDHPLRNVITVPVEPGLARRRRALRPADAHRLQHDRARRARSAPRRTRNSSAPAGGREPGIEARIVDCARHRGAARRGRRTGAAHQPALGDHPGLLPQPRRPRRRPGAMAGSTPATPSGAMRPATTSSSTGSRTRSGVAARTSRRSRWRPRRCVTRPCSRRRRSRSPARTPRTRCCWS